MKNGRKFVLAIIAVILLSIAAPSVIPAKDNIAAVEAKKKARLNRKKVTLVKGSTIKLKVRRKTKKVRWHTTNKKVARVKRGRVTAVSPGKCVVWARHGRRRLKCRIIVRDTHFTVSNSSLTLRKNQTRNITVTSEAKSAITVKTNNKYIATATPISAPGKKMTVRISAQATAGTAWITITEKKSRKQKKIKVTVSGTNEFKLQNGADAAFSLDEGQTRTVYIRCDLMSSLRLSFPGDMLDCTWGSWNGRVIPLRITGENEGQGTVTIQEPVSKKTLSIKVTVNSTEDPDEDPVDDPD